MLRLLFSLTLLITVAGCVFDAADSARPGETAFGRRCGESASPPPSGQLPEGQRLAWPIGSQVWALVPPCETPYLVWEGAGAPFDLAWSRVGDRLAFRVGMNVLVRSTEDADEPVSFASDAGYDWTPDGRLMLYNGTGADGRVASVAGVATGETEQVAESYGLFALSPDGTALAYTSYEDCPPGSIPAGAPADFHCSSVSIADVDDQAEHRIASVEDMLAALPASVNRSLGLLGPVDLHWSAQGEYLTFSACGIAASGCVDSRYVFEVRADGRDLRYIGDFAWPVAWAPGDSRYVYVQQHGRSYDAYPRPIMLSAARLASSRSLSPDGVEDTEPAWSPSGNAIVFASAPSLRTPPCMACPPEAPEQGIWRSDLIGPRERKQLTSSPEWIDSSPQWSRDGAWIAFVRNGPAYVENEGYPKTELWLMREDGSDQHMVADLTETTPNPVPLEQWFDWWTPPG
jgi:Tol biopolymer transport system component